MKTWLKIVGIITFAVLIGLCLMGCGNPAGSSGENLDGTYSKSPWTMTISGNSYIWLNKGINLGKGTISYTDSSFTFTSTHRWSKETSSWKSYVESITGNYSRNGTSFIISGVEGSYAEFNGEWTT